MGEFNLFLEPIMPTYQDADSAEIDSDASATNYPSPHTFHYRDSAIRRIIHGFIERIELIEKTYPQNKREPIELMQARQLSQNMKKIVSETKALIKKFDAGNIPSLIDLISLVSHVKTISGHFKTASEKLFLSHQGRILFALKADLHQSVFDLKKQVQKEQQVSLDVQQQNFETLLLKHFDQNKDIIIKTALHNPVPADMYVVYPTLVGIIVGKLKRHFQRLKPKTLDAIFDHIIRKQYQSLFLFPIEHPMSFQLAQVVLDMLESLPENVLELIPFFNHQAIDTQFMGGILKKILTSFLPFTLTSTRIASDIEIRIDIVFPSGIKTEQFTANTYYNRLRDHGIEMFYQGLAKYLEQNLDSGDVNKIIRDMIDKKVAVLERAQALSVTAPFVPMFDSAFLQSHINEVELISRLFYLRSIIAIRAIVKLGFFQSYESRNIAILREQCIQLPHTAIIPPQYTEMSMGDLIEHIALLEPVLQQQLFSPDPSRDEIFPFSIERFTCETDFNTYCKSLPQAHQLFDCGFKPDGTPDYNLKKNLFLFLAYKKPSVLKLQSNLAILKNINPELRDDCIGLLTQETDAAHVVKKHLPYLIQNTPGFFPAEILLELLTSCREEVFPIFKDSFASIAAQIALFDKNFQEQIFHCVFQYEASSGDTLKPSLLTDATNDINPLLQLQLEIMTFLVSKHSDIPCFESTFAELLLPILQSSYQSSRLEILKDVVSRLTNRCNPYPNYDGPLFLLLQEQNQELFWLLLKMLAESQVANDLRISMATALQKKVEMDCTEFLILERVLRSDQARFFNFLKTEDPIVAQQVNRCIHEALAIDETNGHGKLKSQLMAYYLLPPPAEDILQGATSEPKKQPTPALLTQSDARFFKAADNQQIASMPPPIVQNILGVRKAVENSSTTS